MQLTTRIQGPGRRLFFIGFPLALVGQLMAQPLTVLHSFSSTNDGFDPLGGVIVSGDTLYGTTSRSSGGDGTVFRVSKDGTGFTTLHTFLFNTTEGGYPNTPLVMSGDTLYGLIGGPKTVFAINTDGTGYKTILKFSNPFEVGSDQRLFLVADNVLYGTASLGGPGSGRGNVFKLNTDGTGFTILHTFSGSGEGIRPMGGLVLSGNTLYGMTLGTATTLGTLFKVNVDGTGFATVHTFPAYSTNGSVGTLVLSGNVLYGTNPSGGTEQGNNDGTVFKLNTDGTGYIDLYRFNGLVPGGLVLSGGVLYGTLSSKDASGVKLYRLSTDGTGFSVFYTFGVGVPGGELAVSGNSLYGTTSFLGGTVFAVALPPAQLTISHTGQNICVKWPTSTAGLGLQCSEDPAVPDAWTPVLLSPVIVDGQNTLTIPASGKHQFFRLR